VVEETLQPGGSVAVIARQHGVNANQVFYWRKLYRHLAHHLASVSADTPLVTVIGGRLIAPDQISPLLLNNAEDFRRAVFDRYLVQYQNLLPTGQVVWKDLLFLIAALSPLSVADGHFLKVATTFLGLRNDQIQQAVSTLEKHGLLLRRGGLVRIVQHRTLCRSRRPFATNPG
jgi:hypothetical protein